MMTPTKRPSDIPLPDAPRKARTMRPSNAREHDPRSIIYASPVLVEPSATAIVAEPPAAAVVVEPSAAAVIQMPKPEELVTAIARPLDPSVKPEIFLTAVRPPLAPIKLEQPVNLEQPAKQEHKPVTVYVHPQAITKMMSEKTAQNAIPLIHLQQMQTRHKNEMQQRYKENADKMKKLLDHQNNQVKSYGILTVQNRQKDKQLNREERAKLQTIPALESMFQAQENTYERKANAMFAELTHMMNSFRVDILKEKERAFADIDSLRGVGRKYKRRLCSATTSTVCRL